MVYRAVGADKTADIKWCCHSSLSSWLTCRSDWPVNCLCYGLVPILTSPLSDQHKHHEYTGRHKTYSETSIRHFRRGPEEEWWIEESDTIWNDRSKVHCISKLFSNDDDNDDDDHSDSAYGCSKPLVSTIMKTSFDRILSQSQALRSIKHTSSTFISILRSSLYLCLPRGPYSPFMLTTTSTFHSVLQIPIFVTLGEVRYSCFVLS
jgi:hypothetical protein